MARDEKLKERFDALVVKLSDQFSDGDPLDIEGMIYLVGIQELGKLHRKFKKDEKINLMHIAICRLLSLMDIMNSLISMRKVGPIIRWSTNYPI